MRTTELKTCVSSCMARTPPITTTEGSTGMATNSTSAPKSAPNAAGECPRCDALAASNAKLLAALDNWPEMHYTLHGLNIDWDECQHPFCGQAREAIRGAKGEA